MRQRQRAREARAARPNYRESNQRELRANRQHRRAFEILNQRVVCRRAALMKFIERDQASASRQDIDRKPKIVRTIDAVVGDDVWIRKQYDAAFAVRIIDE